MRVVQGTHPDEIYLIDFTARDAEGVRIKNTDLVISVESDDPDAVTATLLEAQAEPSAHRVQIHYGSANLDTGEDAIANVTVTIRTKDGTLLASGGEQFTVTAGDVAAITGLSFTPQQTAPPAQGSAAGTPAGATSETTAGGTTGAAATEQSGAPVGESPAESGSGTGEATTGGQ